jgi:hypothetical protein
MACRRRKAPVIKAHVAPEAAPPPSLLDEVAPLIRMEREVDEEFRPATRARLLEKLREFDALQTGTAPRCVLCQRAMKSRGQRRAPSLLTRFGDLSLSSTVYRCKPCKQEVRPLWQRLGVEVGQVSGSLARLLALLGVVVPYELAARLCLLFFGIEVSPMAVWRAVQRLGEACASHTEQQARCLGDARQGPPTEGAFPLAVLLGIDGSALGMQVRSTRRRRKDGEVLPPLPPVQEGHFREVKTGVLLLPSERVEPSPGRRSVLRRVLVTCLGNADQVFDHIWAKLCELRWLGPETVIVIVGDGAEWIWNRATLFPKRCEILDFWHAVEKAWEFARPRYGEGSSYAVQFAHRIAEDLRAGRVGDVIARLAKLRAPEEHQERLASLIKYYTDHRTRMRYDEYLRLGYGIGSGAVESSHKQVVHARMRQAGMRWSEAGARRLLALRVLLLNGEWSLLDRLAMKPLAA